MEHTRKRANGTGPYVDSSPEPHTKPCRADRAAGLEAAMEIAKTNNFNHPLEWALVAADAFAKFIHNGEVTKDPFGLEKTNQK